MRKTSLFFAALLCWAQICAPTAYAATRNQESVKRNQESVTRTATVQPRNATTPPRIATTNVVSRSAITQPRGATQISNQPPASAGVTAISNRSTTSQPRTTRISNQPPASAGVTAISNRAATTTTPVTNTFNAAYTECRDVYFTCMDQFCANNDDNYRRCVCSSRLEEIKTKERALGQTATSLQDFADLNIDVISKSRGEVTAMLNASEGESALRRDTSESAQKLSGISAILADTKSQSLNTAGTLDIAGDIAKIWRVTDVALGANIANLTGEKLYNAVHSQCAEYARASCAGTSDLNMAISAYGMYIENDCSLLSNSLAKQTTEASGAIRRTEREMNVARLENYDAHNSAAINECIAQVRTDITADTACGANYVHCLDLSGRYLNRDTGAPIYSPEFYKLDSQTSLSGDVLTNSANRALVSELNRKKIFAARGLDTCRDIADEVWDEFLRQAITEIHQGQQNAIRTVKTECLGVVTECYDTTSASIRNFSGEEGENLLGAQMELSEQMCKTQLDACSNLYGGGPDGMEELLIAMGMVVDQTIAQNCRASLDEFINGYCTVLSTDTLHAYPYGCRTYSPGTQILATNPMCAQTFATDYNTGGIGTRVDPDLDEDNENNTPIICLNPTSLGCQEGCYWHRSSEPCEPTYVPGLGYMNCFTSYTCEPCGPNQYCPGGHLPPQDIEVEVNPTDICYTKEYAGSLYQLLVRHAWDACIAPSERQIAGILPTYVLSDVNMVMDSVKVAMQKQLATECARLGGRWVPNPWIDERQPTGDPGSDGVHDTTHDVQYRLFYTETGTHTGWGYCAEIIVEQTEEN